MSKFLLVLLTILLVQCTQSESEKYEEKIRTIESVKANTCDYIHANYNFLSDEKPIDIRLYPDRNEYHYKHVVGGYNHIIIIITYNEQR